METDLVMKQRLTYATYTGITLRTFAHDAVSTAAFPRLFPRLMFLTNSSITLHHTRSHVDEGDTVLTNGLSDKQSHSGRLVRLPG